MPSHPFIPSPNTVQVNLTFATYGGFAENVYHVKGTGPYTDLPGLMDALDTTFASWDSGHVAGYRASPVHMQKIVCKDLGTQNGAVREYVHDQAGTNTGGTLPDNVTVAIKWVTGFAGRTKRGRTYHVGLPLNGVSGDELISAFQTGLPAQYDALVGAIDGMDFTPYGPTAGHLVVCSYRLNNAWRTEAETTRITHATLADARLDSQRRRLKGRGM